MATVQFKSDKSDVVAAIETVKAIAKDTKQDLGSLLIAMVSAYQSAQNVADNDLQLSESEELEVSEAVATGVTRSELLKTGLLSQARKVKSQAGKLEALKASIAINGENEDTKLKSTIKGIATIRIDRAVEAIMRHNDSNPERKWFITASKIQNLCNSNMGAIKKYLEDNAEMIARHHDQHGLTPEINNRSKKFFSITKDISLKDND